MELNKNSLGYLGIDYQYRLVHEFMSDKSCFKNLASIIDQNMFSEAQLRQYVGIMLEYWREHNETPSYQSVEDLMRSRARTEIELDENVAIVEKIKKMTSAGSSQTIDLAEKFFKQQNIIKAAHEMLRLAGNGNVENYEKCEELMRNALNSGSHDDYEESRVFDGLEDTLSEDYRIVIPTGVKGLDETLSGGIGKGEIALLTGSSSFGKTSLTTALALNASTYVSPQNQGNGFKVMQIVFEDRIKQIQRKHFSKITQVEACKLSSPDNIDDVKKTLISYEDKDMIQNNLRIIRLPSGEKSAWFIEDLIKRHIDDGFRPDLVIIDYFGCLKLKGDSSLSKWDKEAKSMRKLESMASEYNIAIWVAEQGNRESISTEVNGLDKAQGSLQKVQIAHIMISISRTMEEISENKATIAVVKNRAGGAGKIFENVTFNNGTCTISMDENDTYEDFYSYGRAKDSAREKDQKQMVNDIFSEIKQKK